MSLFFLGLAMCTNELFAQTTDVWIGTGGRDGIFHLKLNNETGKLSKPELKYEIAGTGFLAMHPNEKVLYSTAKKEGESGIAAYAIGSGKSGPDLKLLNFVSTGDGGAACVGIDKSGTVAMSAQYGGGSTTSYLLDESGNLKNRVDMVEHGAGSSVDKKRQAKSHPHWVGTSPDNRFLFVPDLGKDAVVVYELEHNSGKIKKHHEVTLPPGSGPRHMKFHTSGNYVYVLNELALTISVFKYDPESAVFTKLQLIETLPDDLKDKHLNSAAEIRVHPSGKFVYSSNRGHDSISVFAVNESTGKLTFVEREPIRGAFPRNFNIDPSGKWLIAGGQHSNSLTVFEIDPTDGSLIYNRVFVSVPSPICILFGPEN